MSLLFFLLKNGHQSAQPQDVMTPDIIAKYDSETESEDQMVKPTNRPNTASCYW